jgi:hypothetical protein
MLELGISARRALACLVLKHICMNLRIDLCGQSQFQSVAPNFWERILNDDQLRGCDDLEKLLVGCEILAALDGQDLLAA